MNYYNEFDPKSAAWLRELINQDLIPRGDVDERSITDVSPDDIRHYTQCHFFAGIGGWSLALQLAGWPEDKPVWTGSCPCQPFSNAGKQLGTIDERHLWPAFFNLIAECKPTAVFGEQVASKLGREWLAGVFANLEGVGYAVAGSDLCAASVGAPHIRQRLYWVADAGRSSDECRQRPSQAHGENGEAQGEAQQRKWGGIDTWHCGAIGGLAHPNGGNPSPEREQCSREQRCEQEDGCAGGLGGMVNSIESGLEGYSRNGDHRDQPRWIGEDSIGSTPSAGGSSFWSDFDILPCTDGKARRVESGTFPLAHGVPGRVGLLRGYGNAIVPQVAAEFIKATQN